MQQLILNTCQQVLVIIGGHAQRLLPYLKHIYPHAAYVLVIDAPKELKRLPSAWPGICIKLFSLGVGHTAQTLCRGLPQHVLDYIRNIGGMSAAGGMGQSILVGRKAGQLLVESADFQQFIAQTLFPELRKRAGGALEEVEFIYVGSMAGATYTGVELPVAKYLAAAVRKLTSAIVRTQFLATGGLTYEGLGTRTWRNAAAALAELLAYATDPQRDARDVRSLRLIEFLVCGLDEALRDAFLAQVEQAAHSTWMTYDEQRTAPNRALDGKFGNLQIWEAAFGTPLDLADDIAPVLSHAYVAPLQNARQSEATAAAERLELEHTRIKLANQSVKDILATAVERPVSAALAELKSPSYQHRVDVWARVSAVVRIYLADLPQQWAKAATTIAQISERLQLLRRLRELLQEDIAERTTEQETLTSEVEDAERLFRKQHALLNPDGVWSYLISAFWSLATKLRRLTTAAETIREINDRLVELQAEQEAVARILAFVESEYEYLRGKLERLILRLKKSAPELGNTAPAVVARPLDVQLPDLWTAVDRTDEEFAVVLRGCVQHVTLVGLAKITGASAPRAGEIAERIVSQNCYATPPVPWGGRLRADLGKQVHLLPPVDNATRDIVTDAVRGLDPRLSLVVTDAAPAVCNLVGITMRSVRALNEALTEPYLNSLVDVLNSPCVEMFLPDGMHVLQSLEIVWNGNQLILPSEISQGEF